MDAGHALQTRLHGADQIIGDLVGGQHFAGKTDVHGIYGFTDFNRQHRALRFRRQLIQNRTHFGVDFGQGLVLIIVQAQVGGDGADAVLAGRGDVVDAVGLRNDMFQRRGDKTGHDFWIGAVISGGHGDHCVFGMGIFQNRQVNQRFKTHHQ